MKRLGIVLGIVLCCTVATGCIFNTGDEEFTVKGTVKTVDGDPLRGVIVFLTSKSNGATLSAITNDNGTFSFGKMDYGSYIIEADPNGFTGYRYEPDSLTFTATSDKKVDFVARED